MRTIRIHVDQPLAPGATLTLPAAAAEHLTRVLRLASGDAVTLFNGDGNDYRANLITAGRRDARAQVTGSADAARESPLALTLAQGIARGDKMDLIVQKATELGVTRIVPLATERSQVRLDAGRAARRLDRWRAIAVGASEQCGRARVPEIAGTMELDEWLGRLPADAGMRLVLSPAASIRVRELQFATPAGILAAGPEGGFGERDLEALAAARFKPLSLGPRILRTETAGLAALAALQAVHGDG